MLAAGGAADAPGGDVEMCSLALLFVTRVRTSVKKMDYGSVIRRSRNRRPRTESHRSRRLQLRHSLMVPSRGFALSMRAARFPFDEEAAVCLFRCRWSSPHRDRLEVRARKGTMV